MGGAVTMKVLTIIGDNDTLDRGDGRVATEGSVSRPGAVQVRAAVLYSTVSADQADVLARWGPGCFGDVLDGELRTDCNSSDIVPLDLPLALLNAYSQAVADPATLRLISPMGGLEYVTVPVQIHYGSWDGAEVSGTPPEWSIKLYKALLEAGKPVKLVAYEGQRHSFINEAWYDFMDTVTKFFNQNVKNVDQ
jgi:hypothetical protein